MIYVGPLNSVPHAITTYKPSHLVSLLDQKIMINTPESIDPAHHLKLAINDIAVPDASLVTPARHHVEQLIEFANSWDRQNPMLIHCWIGVSRSTAAAFIALCALNENHSEHKWAKLLRQRAPHASPNPLMVSLADDLLSRQGRMRDAIAALGPATSVYGELIDLPLQQS